MPAPDYQWAADPELITEALKLLVGAVLAIGSALIAVLLWIWNKTDSKIDRIATSLEALTLTTSTEIAALKATCRVNHPHKEFPWQNP